MVNRYALTGNIRGYTEGNRKEALSGKRNYRNVFYAPYHSFACLMRLLIPLGGVLLYVYMLCVLSTVCREPQELWPSARCILNEVCATGERGACRHVPLCNPPMLLNILCVCVGVKSVSYVTIT